MRATRGPTLLCVLTALATVTVPARAEQQLEGRWALCGAPLTPPARGDPAQREAPQTALDVDASEAQYDGTTGRYTFAGNPTLSRADQRINAERASYTAASGEVDAEGNVRYEEAGAVLEGSRAHFNLNDETGRVEDVRYRIDLGHLHGRAERVVIESAERSRFQEVSLSTCNPGDELWWLRADSLSIDRGTRQGTARNVTLEVADVPVFYTPWLRFPVGSDRLTGFLAPSAGRSGDGGLEVHTPFYWNISPNYDLTVTPGYFTERGAKLDTELRYLQPWAAGEIRVGTLPDDQAYGDGRWAIDQEHRLAVGEHLRGELIQRRVSDDEYLADFGDTLTTTGQSNLESRASLAYSELDWQASADVQSWQTIDDAIAPRNEPYARQPGLRFAYRPLDIGLPIDVALDAEAVDFDHPEPDLRATGRRVDLAPRISAPIGNLGYRIEPAVTWRYTSYDLDRPDPGAASEVERSLPLYSLDARLFLERDTTVGGSELIQTLEPRLFYLYAPERDQDDIPLFDTRPASFSYAQVFREYRFTGPDRIGDANRLALGATSRLLDKETSRELLRTSLGITHDLEPRRINLEGADDPERRTDVVGELRVSPIEALSATLDLRVDPEDSSDREIRSGLRWRPNSRQVVNLGYRERQNTGLRDRRQIEASLALPINPWWQIFAGIRHDLDDNRTQEGFAGFQYEDCCYAIRAVHRTYLAPAPGGGLAEREQQFLIEFEFKGLGGVGDRLLDFLGDSVPGYRPARF